MGIETEKKYRLTAEQRDFVLKNLQEESAEFVREDFEINQIYGGGILKAQKSVLRIRKTDGKVLLTYKRNVKTYEGVKQHTEYETKISNAGEMEKIVESLGFELSLLYEKRRQTWNFKNVEIVLDELPFGLYMEIEGKITDIATAEMLLDIEDFEAEERTYPKLTEIYGVENGAAIEARFAG